MIPSFILGYKENVLYYHSANSILAEVRDVLTQTKKMTF